MYVEQQLRRLMVVRVAVVTTLLLAAAYVDTLSEWSLVAHPLYLLVAGMYALTILYALASKWLPRHDVQAQVQVGVDLLLITALVYLMGGGGARAGFAVLYPLSVLSGGAMLDRRPALGLAAWATALYGGALWLVRARLIPPAALGEVLQLPLKQVLFSVFVTGVACGLVALTGGYFSESLRTAGERLEKVAGEVAELREIHSLIIDSLRSGLMLADLDGRVQHLNAFGADLLGRSAQSVVGRTVRQVFGSSLEASALEARASRGEWSRMEFSYARADGTNLPLGLSVAPLASSTQSSRGYLLVFQDLTAVKALEEQVRTKEKLAAIGEVAARLAHEIRNPLGSISGSAQVLMAEANVSEEQARLLAIITKESRRLSDSLNQFLLETRSPTRPPAPVDLGALIREGVTLLRNGPEVGEAHVVRLDVEPGPHLCLADADRVTQVFWNLARNGLEAMPRGGVLSVRLRSSRDAVVLSLRDEGRGPDAAKPPISFLPSAGGPGLGLAIVYQIVREHHGDIAVRPAPPNGTEVEVRLPRLQVGTAA